jgi:predicted permease
VGVEFERFVRWLAAHLVRGAGGDVVLGDLEEAMRRDVSRGVSARRARLRFLANAVASSFSLARSRVASARGGPFRRLGASWLDVKLGVRMLAKYPGLTAVGGVAIAVAVAAGTFVFGVFSNFLYPELPLPAAERLVGLQNRDAETGQLELRSAHDFVRWREQLRSVEELSAFVLMERNLIEGEGAIEPVPLAAMSASAFRALRVPPVLGRPLVEADEAAGAEPVVVLGHVLWRGRFGGAADIVGRRVRIGDETATVVGVMPEGFGFPVRQQAWTPLRVVAHAHGPREGPAISMFGRLAPGASIETARAELAAIGSAVDGSSGTAALRPRLLWYPHMIMPPGGTEARVVRSMLAVLMLIASVNVATLVFARAATREAEIAVRAALGASRRRILLQLFLESLVLVGLGTGVGVLVAALVLDWGTGILLAGFDLTPPFWWHIGLGPRTLAYVAGAALLGTLVVGVVPALKVTRSLGQGLQQAGARTSGPRFGGVWTAIVVFQVALAIAVVPMVGYVARDSLRYALSDAAFPADEFLTIRLEMDAVTGGPAQADAARVRFARFQQELERRVLAEPGVTAVAFANRLPGMEHPPIALDTDGPPPAGEDGRVPNAGTAGVHAGFFDALGAPVLAGRDFRPDDAAAGARVAIVSESFVRLWLDGRNAVGRRVRPRGPDESPEPWIEIVGVAPDLGKALDEQRARIYFPFAPGGADAVRLAVRTAADADAFAPRLRALVAALDPTVRVSDTVRLDRLALHRQRLYNALVGFVAGLAAVALLLSAAGTYALMSFTVARRTREIGIRAALGARGAQLRALLLQDTLRLVGAGLVVGYFLAWLGAGTIRAFLFQVEPFDPLVTGGVGVTIVVLALVVSLRPAFAATRLDLARVLRGE